MESTTGTDIITNQTENAQYLVEIHKENEEEAKVTMLMWLSQCPDLDTSLSQFYEYGNTVPLLFSDINIAHNLKEIYINGDHTISEKIEGANGVKDLNAYSFDFLSRQVPRLIEEGILKTNLASDIIKENNIISIVLSSIYANHSRIQSMISSTFDMQSRRLSAGSKELSALTKAKQSSLSAYINSFNKNLEGVSKMLESSNSHFIYNTLFDLAKKVKEEGVIDVDAIDDLHEEAEISPVVPSSESLDKSFALIEERLEEGFTEVLSILMPSDESLLNEEPKGPVAASTEFYSPREDIGAILSLLEEAKEGHKTPAPLVDNHLDEASEKASLDDVVAFLAELDKKISTFSSEPSGVNIPSIGESASDKTEEEEAVNTLTHEILSDLSDKVDSLLVAGEKDDNNAEKTAPVDDVALENIKLEISEVRVELSSLRELIEKSFETLSGMSETMNDEIEKSAALRMKLSSSSNNEPSDDSKMSM